MYIDGPWWDDERDEEGVHILEDLLVAGWMKEAHPRSSARNTCIQPSFKTKTIEDPIASRHAEEKTKYTQDYIHHLEVQQIDMDITTN